MHLLLCLLAALQAPDSGAFVITLGTDTIALERYTRTADRLVDDMVLRERAPVIVRHFVATLTPDGSVARLELDNAVPGDPARPPVHSVGRFTTEQAFFDVTRNGRTTSASVLTPDGALPFLGYSFALYEQVNRRARALGGNPVKVPAIEFGASVPFDFTVTFPAPDSMGVAFPDEGPTLFRVDAAGRVLGADGRLTTRDVTATRVPSLDIAAFAAAFAPRPLGQLSPPDSVRVTIAGAAIAIDYGRPSMRGRKIFGGVVPWNQVWRTGANFATRFTTSADLALGGQVIPKGSYTLWTLPTPAGWKLIINKQTKAPCQGERCTLPSRPFLWGTDYSADSDFVRVDMKVDALARPVEQFTITVVPQGQGGVLTMDWETTRVSIPFTRK